MVFNTYSVSKIALVLLLALTVSSIAYWAAFYYQLGQSAALALEQNKKIAEDLLYAQALSKFNAGLWEGAKPLFSRINEDSPHYQDAKRKLDELQDKITDEKIRAAVEKAAAELQKQAQKAEEVAAEAVKSANEANSQLQSEKTKNREADLSNIVNRWKPKVVHVECEFQYANGIPYSYNTGSGTLVYSNDGKISVVTNKHVILNQLGFGAHACKIVFPDGKGDVTVTNTGAPGSSVRVSATQEDWGMITIEHPNEYARSVAASGFKKCTGEALVGDSIVILGYPVIGSRTGITATKGIISGYDGNYYISDAKIEQGNSGGVAVLVKDNCYLGIPTFVVVGEIESLARILDQKVIFSN